MRDLDAELTCALEHVTDPEVVPGATSRRLLELTLRAVADDRTRQDAEIARLQHELFAWRNTATLAQNEEKSLRHELAEAQRAAKTWENEAERRSRRYEKCAVELAEAREALREIAHAHDADSRRLRLMAADALMKQTTSDQPHTHTDECWEPDSGCDMGRNADHVVVVTDDECRKLVANWRKTPQRRGRPSCPCGFVGGTRTIIRHRLNCPVWQFPRAKADQPQPANNSFSAECKHGWLVEYEPCPDCAREDAEHDEAMAAASKSKGLLSGLPTCDCEPEPLGCDYPHCKSDQSVMHQWVEVTQVGDPGRRWLCRRCGDIELIEIPDTEVAPTTGPCVLKVAPTG